MRQASHVVNMYLTARVLLPWAELLPFLVIVYFNKFLAFYDVYKYNTLRMMMLPRMLKPTSKVNGGIIVVLLRVV